jgi:hypothetical protein
MNVSIHKAAINVHVQKATIRLEISVQVNNLFNMNRDFKVSKLQISIPIKINFFNLKKYGVERMSIRA